MGDVYQTVPDRVELLPADPPNPSWSFLHTAAFRFCFIYFTLYCLTTQIILSLFPIPIENFDNLDPSQLWPVRTAVFWAAAHVFGAKLPLVYSGSGSGDKTFDWVLAFCVLVIAALGTAVWFYFDRRRPDYITLNKWFRVFLRFALASQMIVYGLVKAVPLQMPFPHLARLLEPFGNFSLMGVLWSSIGASPPYEIFAGCAELLAGILLIIPRTTVLGALLALIDLIQVFMLNMTYDVPVKLFSFHLILISVFLLAPEFSRLVAFFLHHRVTGLSPQPPLFRKPRTNRIALAAQIVFGLLLIAGTAFSSWQSWHKYGGGSPKSPLYGIWTVDEMSVNGQPRPPLLTDDVRWRRVIFDSPAVATFQHMDDSLQWINVAINEKDGTLALTKGGDKNWKSNLKFRRPASDRLILDGTLDYRTVHMQLQLMDRQKLMLVSRGFHWIQDYPFNR